MILSFSETNAQVRQKSKTKKSVSVKKSKTTQKAFKAKENRKDRPVVIVRNGKKYVLDEEEGLKRFDQPREAEEWFLKKRLANGMKELPVERYFTAIEKIKNMQRYSTADGKLYPSESDAPNLKEGASNQEKSDENTNSAGQTSGVLGTWTHLGPGNVGGRTRALLIDPTNPSIMYAGAVAGGIWKSTNGGATWVALDDFLANIAVNSLAFDPANSNIIYAGTGEGFFNADAVRGAGIFKTTNAGVTWTRLASTTGADFFQVQDIVVSNVNSQNVYAATRTGVHRSLDGGVTWTNVLASNAANGNNGAMDLVIRTDQTTDYVFAALGTFAQSHIFRNTDAGGAGTWTDVYTESAMGRTSLAIAPSNQNVIYALSAQQGAGSNGSYQDGLLAVFRSTSNGDLGSWTTQVRNNSVNRQDTLLLSNPVNGALTECGFGINQFFNQGWYDNVIAVDPTDSNVVWAGGIDLFRSDNGGTNWGVASYWWFQGNGVPPANSDPNTVHADNHIIVFQPGYNGASNQTMFVGNDGGVFKTTNAKTGNVGYTTGTTPGGGTITNASPICGNPVANSVIWSPINNGYQVTQFYHGLPYPNGQTFFGGTQDNGTNRGTIGGGINAWERINGGDGGYVAVNPANTQQIFVETTGLSIRRSDDGGTNFTTRTTGISGDTFPFITVFQMDPTTPTRLWIGGRFLWRTDNSANNWTRTSDAQQTGGSITAIAIAPTNSNVVINGAASGQIRRTTVATTATSTSVLNSTWFQSFTPRGNGFGTVSWLAYDPSNINNVYATFSTFNAATSGNGFGHVFKSADGGATWTLIDGNQTANNPNAIPDIPVHSIVVDPNNGQRLYVGTDLGVFVSLDGGANWARETTGFSNVVTESLSILNNNGVSSLYAFTHGRSAFKVTIPASCVTVSPLSQTLNYLSQSGTVTVTKNVGATNTCDWNAVSNSNFITLTSVSLSGVDNGTLNFTLSQNPDTMMRSGTITVAGTIITINQSAAPTAANATIQGRVLDTTKRGIPGAVVKATNLNGQTRTVVTNNFGYFKLEDLQVGSTYTLTANHKEYQFPTRVVNLNEDLSDFNIFATQ